MPTNCYISLPEIAVTDWLNKLGEPAFVAWIRFRTWREHNELKIPVRQIIQKLGVANNTFYTKILKPLWEHGLIDTHRPEKDKRKLYLQVYDAPQNRPEKAHQPLQPIRFYQPAPPNCFNECTVLLDETNLLEETHSKNETISFHETNSISNVPPSETNLPPNVASPETFQVEERSTPYLINIDKDLLKDKKDKRDKIDRSLFSTLSSLPKEIQVEIERNVKLLDQAYAVIELYQQWKYDPSFSILEFIEIMNRCIEKVQNKSAFKSYFQTALSNQWRPKKAPTPSPTPKSSTDLPPWIIEQDERKRSGCRVEEEKISPEDQAEIDEYKRQLGIPLS
jgi:DNA-binding MarR family transcriptional regulator